MGEDLKKESKIKGEKLSASFRGGKREGAGRPSKGIKRTIAVTLPAEEWSVIDRLIQLGMFNSYADFFRILYNRSPHAEKPKERIPKETDLNQAKVCKTCSTSKSLREFGYRTKEQRFTAECKSCSNEKKRNSAFERERKKRSLPRP